MHSLYTCLGGTSLLCLCEHRQSLRLHPTQAAMDDCSPQCHSAVVCAGAANPVEAHVAILSDYGPDSMPHSVVLEVLC